MSGPTVYEVTTVDGDTVSRHSDITRACEVVRALANDGRRARLYQHDVSAAGHVERTTLIHYRPRVAS